MGWLNETCLSAIDARDFAVSFLVMAALTFLLWIVPGWRNKDTAGVRLAVWLVFAGYAAGFLIWRASQCSA